MTSVQSNMARVASPSAFVTASVFVLIRIDSRRNHAAAVQAVCNGPHHKAPQYMTHCCIHTSDIARRQHLRSAGCHQLFVPRHRRSMFGRRACSVAGPAACNSLPDYLRDPSRTADSFRRDLKTFFSRFTSVHSALKALRLCAV